MTQQHSSAGNSANELDKGSAQQTPQAKKPLGKPTMQLDQIPSYVAEKVSAKIEGASLAAARENGSYYGKVVYTDARHIGQVVGKAGTTVVLHRREDMQMVGQQLAWRLEQKKLNGAEMRVHYNEGKAKAYPFDQERYLIKQQERKAQEPAKEVKDLLERAGTKNKAAEKGQAAEKKVDATEKKANAPEKKTAVKRVKKEPAKTDKPAKQADRGLER